MALDQELVDRIERLEGMVVTKLYRTPSGIAAAQGAQVGLMPANDPQQRRKMREWDCPCDNRDNKPHHASCAWKPLERAIWAAFVANLPDEFYRLKQMDPIDFEEDRKRGH